MRPARLLYLFVLLSSLVFPATAQQPKPPASAPQRDSQALALISQSISAMGALASPSRATLAEGTISYPNGQQKQIKMETMGTDHLRHDVGSGDFSFVTAAGQDFLIMQGARHKLRVWATQYKRPEHLPALSLMSEYQNPNLQTKYMGLEQINGLPAHHIRLSMLPTDSTPAQIEDLISEFHVWIDQASLFVVKTRCFNFSPEAMQNRSPVDVYYSDYRLQGGAQIPFHLIRHVDGQKDSDIVFSTISLNASVAPTDFQ